MFVNPTVYSATDPYILAGNPLAVSTVGTIASAFRSILIRSFDMNRVFGVDKRAYLTDDVYSATTSSNPEEKAYGIVAVEPLDGSTTITVRGRLSITFTSIMFDRHDFNVVS